MRDVDVNSTEYQSALLSAKLSIQRTGEIPEEIIIGLLGNPPSFGSPDMDTLLDESENCNKYAIEKSRFIHKAFKLATTNTF